MHFGCLGQGAPAARPAEVTYEAERDGVFFRKLFIYHAGAASPLEIAIEGVGEE